MSSISAGTSAGTALVQTGDTTGALVIKTGGSGTTAATFNADQTTTFAGAVSAPSFSGTASTATTATNLAGGSAGTVPYQSAAGTTAMLAAGSSGQVLTSSGAGAPTWTTPSSGAYVLLSSSTVNGASAVDFTGFVSSDYHSYTVVFSAVDFTSGSPGGAVQVYIGGTLQTSSNYHYSGFYTDSAGSGLLNRYSGSAQNSIRISNGSNLNQFGTITFTANTFNGLTGTSVPTFICNVGGGWPVSTTFYQIGSYNSTSPITGIRILSSGGTIIGYFKLYGIKNS